MAFGNPIDNLIALIANVDGLASIIAAVAATLAAIAALWTLRLQIRQRRPVFEATVRWLSDQVIEMIVLVTVRDAGRIVVHEVKAKKPRNVQFGIQSLKGGIRSYGGRITPSELQFVPGPMSLNVELPRPDLHGGSSSSFSVFLELLKSSKTLNILFVVLTVSSKSRPNIKRKQLITATLKQPTIKNPASSTGT